MSGGFSALQQFLDTQTVTTVPTKKEQWHEFCNSIKRKKCVLSKELIEKETFKTFDTLQKNFTSVSILTCHKCKSNNISCISRQIARADESETFFAKCLTCHHHWKFR